MHSNLVPMHATVFREMECRRSIVRGEVGALSPPDPIAVQVYAVVSRR
jgi:hypothetical protein